MNEGYTSTKSSTVLLKNLKSRQTPRVAYSWAVELNKYYTESLRVREESNTTRHKKEP